MTQWDQIPATIFFLKNLESSVTRYHGQLLSCIISEKNNDPILKKLCDRWMDKHTDRLKQTGGQTDRWTEESDFIECCPTNIEHPKDFVK